MLDRIDWYCKRDLIGNELFHTRVSQHTLGLQISGRNRRSRPGIKRSANPVSPLGFQIFRLSGIGSSRYGIEGVAILADATLRVLLFALRSMKTATTSPAGPIEANSSGCRRVTQSWSGQVIS